MHLEAQLESIRCRRAMWETRRAMYDAENAQRAAADLAPAYGEAAYVVIDRELGALAAKADDLGVYALKIKQGGF
ncbi:MAG: hypothetical protein ABFD65_15000 [Candidatus Polarisedimenticolia bacterium]